MKDFNLDFLFSKEREDNVNVEFRTPDRSYNVWRRVVEISKTNVWSEYWEVVAVFKTFVDAQKESTKFNLRIAKTE